MNILSFDIEDWFHILDNDATKTEVEWNQFESRLKANMERIHNLLDKYNQKATFFCLGWVAQKYPEIIKTIAEKGHEIASHSHLHQLAYQQNRKEFEADLVNSIDSIEQTIGKKVRVYRAPGFSVMNENKWVFEILCKHGIEIDCSIFPAKRSHGGFQNFGSSKPCWIDIDGIKMKEFPINLSYILSKPFIFSGGGYFRLLPSFLLKQLFKRSEYVMTYFHPRDFDSDQPMVPGLNALRKFKSYYGINGAMGKLEKLIQTQNFIDLQTANDKINWETADIIRL